MKNKGFFKTAAALLAALVLLGGFSVPAYADGGDYYDYEDEYRACEGQRTYAASIGKGYPFRKIPVLTLRAEWGFCLYPHRLSPVGADPWEVSQTLCNDERRRKPCRTSRKQS